MKIRSDFVSNSSSSSFIVITNSGDYENPWKDMFVDESFTLPCEEGCGSFGWQTQKYYSCFDKLNWAAICLWNKKKLESDETPDRVLKEEVAKPWFRYKAMEELLRKVCREKFGIEIAFDEEKLEGYDYYIDHQSNIRETPENGRMFESYETLYDFLANSHSYIDNSNDNGGRDDEYDPETDSYPERPQDYTV